KRTGRQLVEKFPVLKRFLDDSWPNAWLKGDALVLYARLYDHEHFCATALVPQGGRYRVTVSAYAVGTQGKPLTMALLCEPVRERGASHELQSCHDVPENKPTLFEAQFNMNRECNVWIAAWSLPDRYEFF